MEEILIYTLALIGGALTSDATWRWCFFINLPIGGASFAIILLTFQTPKASKPQEASIKEKLLQLDLNGTALLLSAVICYILALQWGGTIKPWSSPDVIGCFVGFGTILLAFVANELFMGDRAMLQRQLITKRMHASLSAFVFL